jgi:hypothetical protein
LHTYTYFNAGYRRYSQSQAVLSCIRTKNYKESENRLKVFLVLLWLEQGLGIQRLIKGMVR